MRELQKQQQRLSHVAPEDSILGFGVVPRPRVLRENLLSRRRYSGQFVEADGDNSSPPGPKDPVGPLGLTPQHQKVLSALGAIAFAGAAIIELYILANTSG